MHPIIRHTIITAFRDYLFVGLIAVLLLAIFVSCFLGNTALSEQNEMAIAYISGTTRMILSIGLIVFVCFHVRRAFDNKEIEVAISKPISRTKFILAYWLGFAVIAFAMIITLTSFIYIFSKPSHSGLLIWACSMLFETFMIIAFSLLAALILNSAITAVLASMSFYIMSRLMGFFTASIVYPVYTSVPNKDNIWTWLMEWNITLTSTIVPRLDLFGKTNWLVYGNFTHMDVKIVLLQSVIYIPLLLSVAVFDFKRKQF